MSLLFAPPNQTRRASEKAEESFLNDILNDYRLYGRQINSLEKNKIAP